MKRNLAIILIIAIVILLLVGGVLILRSRKAKEPSVTKKPEGVLIETSLEERPYINLTPSSDGHWLTIEVSRIKETESLEYELLYNTASGATQGSINTVSLNGKSSYSKKILLGSESSGHYKYDEGVTQGTLTVRLRGGRGTRKFVSEFHLQQSDEELISIDGNFSLKGILTKGSFYITMSTTGLAGEFQGKVIVGPYEIFSSGSKTVKNGVVSLKLPEGTAEAKIYSWSGTSWKEEESTSKDKTISTSISSLTTFIVTTSE